MIKQEKEKSAEVDASKQSDFSPGLSDPHPRVAIDSTSTSDDGVQLEQSFEVISRQATMSTNDETGKGRPVTISQPVEPGNPGQQVSSPTRSNSSKEDSTLGRVRKSGSFLSRLQQSFPDHPEDNIPSSLVSAFTSLTSSFNLGSHSTNGISNNHNGSASSLTIETSSNSTRLSLVSESREDIFQKKATLERKNLISLTKLIVKDLISTSLQSSRVITEDCQNTIHLNNYFTLLDRVLKHGLKHNILSNRSMNLWSALDSLPKYLKESTLMSESIRSLTNTKTPDGKIKAWLRLAMMQKKLPEYFNELLANKNTLLKDVYHEFAFMLNDEAHVFAGLIIGVNVIDCNFFVKDANFDLMDDIIDLSPYLRLANSTDEDLSQEIEITSNADVGEYNLKVILDQKNYLEEWNKRLESTIVDLQTKMKNLEEHNSKLEMEIKVSEARIQRLMSSKGGDLIQEKSRSGSSLAGALKNFIGNNDISSNDLSKVEKAREKVEDDKDELSASQNLTAELKGLQDSQEITGEEVKLEGQELCKPDNNNVSEKERVHSLELESLVEQQEKELVGLRERTAILEASYRSSLERIKTLERDLDVQTSINTDKETTIMIYEKDIREKQAQVESARAALADFKKLNSDLSERLNDTNTRLKERIKSITTLQASLDRWKLENKTLSSRLQDKLSSLKNLSGEHEKAKATIADLKSYNEKVNNELKRERESGHSSTVELETQNSKIRDLTDKLTKLENELRDVKPFKDRTDELEKRCKDYEQSLEEIGAQLRESRLEVENLRENSAVFLDSQWMDSKQIKSCALCQQSFSVTRRKHHCRLCGHVFCQTCSDNKMELASSSKPVRVCDTCHAFLLAKFVKSSS